MKRRFGLVGYPLSHSFSKRYFTEKFLKNNLADCSYSNFELSDLDPLPQLLKQEKNLMGLNVTIPYKKAILPYLSFVDPPAAQMGAVNTIRIIPGDPPVLLGYNTDIIGFKISLLNFIGAERPEALVLGTGGAAKAVAYVLQELHLHYTWVSRSNTPSPDTLNYQEVDEAVIQQNKLIINTTPLGMFPNMDEKPEIPYHAMDADHFLFDLVYNPASTAFLKAGQDRGARIRNGLEMLELQAEAAWEIWNRD